MIENTASPTDAVGTPSPKPNKAVKFVVDFFGQKKKSLLGETLRDPSRSLLRKWLTPSELKRPDIGWWRVTRLRRARRWKAIGWEVFERKALLASLSKAQNRIRLEAETRVSAGGPEVEVVVSPQQKTWRKTT